MRKLCVCAVAIFISGCSSNVGSVPEVKTAQTPKPSPNSTSTPFFTVAERRLLAREAERQSREKRRRRKEDGQRVAEAERYRKSQLSSNDEKKDIESDTSEIAFQLATIDNGYVERDDRSVKRFQYLLDELSSNYKESPQKISDMTVNGRKMLADAGVSESLEIMMNGMNQVMPQQMLSESGRNMQSYAEYLTLYVMNRKQGKSHETVVDEMKSMTGF